VNLHAMLLKREAAGRPVRIGMIGAGKFGTMFLTQLPSMQGVHLVGLADLDIVRARRQLDRAGWPASAHSASSCAEAVGTRRTHLTEDADALLTCPDIEMVVEATGDPRSGIGFALRAIAHGKHIVMVNVEADALAGPLLARKAQAAGLIYSLAWGDQPALICEHVDWARTCGFTVVAAGKGTRYHPSYHQSTPDTVWDILDKYLKIEDRSSINPKMFNSFVDGSKSAIEMTAVCNATGLSPQSRGLGFPPATRFELAEVCKPTQYGGKLEKAGVTEVVSSIDRDEHDVPHHLAMGTFVVFEGDTSYARRCFGEYHLLPDSTGRFAALYRPTHMIGLELGVSIASIALRHEPTGMPVAFHSDVVAVAKRPLRAREVLDGEGGFCVWGRQMPAYLSLKDAFLPLGLAQHVRTRRDIASGEPLRWSDVDYDGNDEAIKARREMEAVFGRCEQTAQPAPGSAPK